MNKNSNEIYQTISPNPPLAQLEITIGKFWKDNNIFQKSIDNRKNCKEFIFYDGPPFANGMPHYGHLLTGFIKDCVCRFQTMIGKKTNRRFGWDCHGLPAEMAAEKELGISGRKNIEDYGVDKFNQHCRESVMKYASEWREYVERQGRWVDFDNDYKTMDIKFMESVMWVFKQLHNKGLIYKSLRVMPYSWACETPLSNFETRMDNAYRQKASKAVTAIMPLTEIPHHIKSQYPNATKCNILIWTTTPWTLPSNVAVAIGEDIQYATFSNSQETEVYICAKSKLTSLVKITSKNLNLELQQNDNFTFKGSELLNAQYKPLFDYFADTPNAFKVLAGDFVTEESGTGVVHIASGFGEDDFNLCAKHNIPVVCPVNNSGLFTNEVPDYEGMMVFDTNDLVIKAIKEKGLWIQTEQYLHNYPHCWRTDQPLIYKALPSWYVAVEKIKDKMIQANQDINWTPSRIKDGQFGKWLANARDWSISRQRFWGAPIPVWESDNPKYPRIDVYGSIAELEKDFGVKVTDLHKPFIDQLTRPNPDDPTGKSTMRRTPDVFDCWFESGAMPYGQAHYPFENEENFNENFPADFITEYIAQTRGWFYTLTVLSVALHNKAPFKNCICHGVVLDEKGQKLSKKLKNYEDPLTNINKYGADAMRFLMLSNNIMQGRELLLDKEGTSIKDTLRLTIKPMWNAYYFFALYANADKMSGEFNASGYVNFNGNTTELDELNLYILSKCKVLVGSIRESMIQYDIQSACKDIESFFDILNNWYIRRNKKVFWQSEKTALKQGSYNTLYTVLVTICKIMAPFAPFVSELIYKNLTDSNTSNPNENSVHLCDFPSAETFLSDNSMISSISARQIMEKMDSARDACTTALAIRNELNIRIRQPLSKLTYITSGDDSRSFLHDQDWQQLILEEVNIKTFEVTSNLSQYASQKIKINFPNLAKRIPQKIKDITMMVKQEKWSIDKQGNVFVGDEQLQPEEYEVILESTAGGNVKPLPGKEGGAIWLDSTITEDLLLEGIARDIVRFVQEMRKSNQLNITDNILLNITSDDATIIKALETWRSYISEQTLTTSLTVNSKSLGLEIAHNILQSQIKLSIKVA